MAAPTVSQTGILYPSNYARQTNESLDLLEEHWDKTYPHLNFSNFGDLTNEFILDEVGPGLSMDTAIENVSGIWAQEISDSTGFNVDSMKTMIKGAFLDLHFDNTVTNPKISQEEKNKSKFAGTLSAMEDSRKHFELVKTIDIKKKSNEFTRLKSLYDLADDATMDDAYGKFLEDLSPGELKSIYNSGELSAEKEYSKKVLDKKGKETGDKILLGREKMIPIPFSASKWEEQGPRGQVYGGIAGPQFSVGKIVHTDVKFTEELFEDYLYREKKQQLIDYAKKGGKKIDWNQVESAARGYASDRAEEGFKIYQNYQRESLKDLVTNDISDAIDRLENAKEHDRQIQGIFTD